MQSQWCSLSHSVLSVCLSVSLSLSLFSLSVLSLSLSVCLWRPELATRLCSKLCFLVTLRFFPSNLVSLLFLLNRCLVERILNISFVPFNADPDVRMRRLYHLYSNLDEKAVKCVFPFKVPFAGRLSILSFSAIYRQNSFVDLCLFQQSSSGNLQESDEFAAGDEKSVGATASASCVHPAEG